MTDLRVEALLVEIADEYRSAASRFTPFHSPHEGYAVLLEEVDELWDEVRRKGVTGAELKAEALQVAAMGLRFMVDCCGADDGPGIHTEKRRVTGRDFDMEIDMWVRDDPTAEDKGAPALSPDGEGNDSGGAMCGPPQEPPPPDPTRCPLCAEPVDLSCPRRHWSSRDEDPLKAHEWARDVEQEQMRMVSGGAVRALRAAAGNPTAQPMDAVYMRRWHRLAVKRVRGEGKWVLSGVKPNEPCRVRVVTSVAGSPLLIGYGAPTHNAPGYWSRGDDMEILVWVEPFDAPRESGELDLELVRIRDALLGTQGRWLEDYTVIRGAIKDLTVAAHRSPPAPATSKPYGYVVEYKTAAGWAWADDGFGYERGDAVERSGRLQGAQPQYQYRITELFTRAPVAKESTGEENESKKDSGEEQAVSGVVGKGGKRTDPTPSLGSPVPPGSFPDRSPPAPVSTPEFLKAAHKASCIVFDVAEALFAGDERAEQMESELRDAVSILHPYSINASSPLPQPEAPVSTPEPEAETPRDCDKCAGSGWVWGDELDPPEDPVTDARHTCPRCEPEAETPRQWWGTIPAPEGEPVRWFCSCDRPKGIPWLSAREKCLKCGAPRPEREESSDG